MKLKISKTKSPVGEITIVADRTHLYGLDFEGNEERLKGLMQRHWNAGLVKAGTSPFDEAINAYFDGNLHALCAVPTRLNGTPFQIRVWQALRSIKIGQTWSYKKLANQIGQAKAVRAVGAANGRNPIALVHPCHRVLGSDGSLTGFAGGVHRKKWLLNHERAKIAQAA
jgi:methylated-DNA-[protein]-cysteine S-methyltransferase